MWDHLPPGPLTHAATLLNSTSDRQSTRCTCRAWRAALDAHWQRAAFLARLDDDARLLHSFLALDWLWHRLRSLDLVELGCPSSTGMLLEYLNPTNFPHLTRLGLSSTLHQGAGDHCTGGHLQQLRLPSLRELRLDCGAYMPPLSALPPMEQLQQLTALHICGWTRWEGKGPELLAVSRLTALSQLKDLTLPTLDQEERQQLSLLTGLTALSFGAGGRGAVGANLLPLRALRALRITLCHRREHFLVLHPSLEWEALAGMEGLTRLELLNWAAGRRNAAPVLSSPVFVWAEQGELESHAATLLAGLPQLRSLRITAAYCRLEKKAGAVAGAAVAGAEVTEGRAGGSYAAGTARASAERAALQLGSGNEHSAKGGDNYDDDEEEEEGVIKEVVHDARGRVWERREQRLPLQPGGSRGGDWHRAWWQGDVQGRLQELFGLNDPSLQRYRLEQQNVQGHINMRPELPQTFDLELCCRLLKGGGEEQRAS